MKKVHYGVHLLMALTLLLTLLFPALHHRRSFAHADSGLNWPGEQVLPHFCCITSLDVINLNGLQPDMHTLFVTLQGLINRTQPRIYVHEGDEKEGINFWLDKLDRPYVNITDPFSLITKYRGEIAGTVIYDPTVPDTINLATTIASLKGGIVASPRLATILSSDPYNLPILVDLRSNRFPSKLAVYRYAYNTYWQLAEHRLIIGIDGRLPGTVRDYAMATKAMVLWLDPRIAAEKALLDAFFQGMAPGSSYLGWWANETVGVQEASSYGIATYAADFSSNLTVLGATPHTIFVPKPPPPPPLRHKIYVTMIMSDGDNIQLTQHRLPQKWADPMRGQVPIGWTINPGLVDLAPVMLNYYWGTATKNDVLISGPSGLGYVQANVVPANALTTYTQQTATYLRAAGLRVITIWNTSPFMPNAVASAYARNIHTILGMTTESGANADYTGQQLFAGMLPIISLTVPYATSIYALEQAITNAGIGFTSMTGPRFIAVQADTYRQGISPTTLYLVQQYFIHNPDYQFVRPDHFFQLFKESRSRTFLTHSLRPVTSRHRLASDPAHSGQKRSASAIALMHTQAKSHWDKKTWIFVRRNMIVQTGCNETMHSFCCDIPYHRHTSHRHKNRARRRFYHGSSSRTSTRCFCTLH